MQPLRDLSAFCWMWGASVSAGKLVDAVATVLANRSFTKIFEDVMKGAKLPHHELNAALRDAGCACVSEVQMAILENTGAISVVPRVNPSPPSTA